MRFLLLALGLLLSLPAVAADYKASIVFNGCNTEQQQALQAALDDTYTYVRQVATQVQRQELGDYLKAWFGAGKRETVRRTLQSIQAQLEKEGTLVMACEERQCDHDLMGYTDSSTISVCPDFFESKPDQGYDSRFGTLVHEFSHMTADTDDHAYGTADARKLAVDSPREAIDNADNYQYFMEAVIGHDTLYPTTAWTEADSCQWALDGECDHAGHGTGSCEINTDTTDCRNASPRPASNAKAPSVGAAHPKNTCATALNGQCDSQCAVNTDYTDCLTGHMVKARP